MAVELPLQSSDIPVIPNDVGAVGVAWELKELTTDPAEVVVRPEAARAKLVACAQTVRWCTAVVRPRQGSLGGGSNSAKVHWVMGTWSRGWQWNRSNASSSGVGALPPTHVDTVLSTQWEESSKLEHGTTRVNARWGRVAG